MFMVVLLAVLGAACAKDYCYCLTANGVNVRSSACGSWIGRANKGQCFKDLSASRYCTLSGRRYRFRKLRFNSRDGWIASNYLTRQTCSTGSGSWTWRTGRCNRKLLVSRAQWKAKSPKSRTSMKVPVGKLFIHHTAGKHCTTQASCSAVVRGIQNYHMNTKGWWDIGYNWLVGEDGKAYEGRGWKTVGAHTKGHNSNSVAISVMGDFSKSSPRMAAKSAIENLIACARNDGILTSTYKMWGHRDASGTACPGAALYAQVKRHPHYSSQKP